MAIRRPPTTFSDSITGADLASDIAVSTTGNIATTGSGTLAVAGASTLTGNVAAAGTLAVTGASTLTGAQTLTGNTTLAGTLAVASTSTLTGASTHTAGLLTDTIGERTSTTGVTIDSLKIKDGAHHLPSAATGIFRSDGSTVVLSEASNVATLNNVTLGSSAVFPAGAVVKHQKVLTVISASQAGTETYVDITGSSITYTPATGADYIVYECSFVSNHDTQASPLFAFKFLIDGTITKNQDSYSPFAHLFGGTWSSIRETHKMVYSASGWTTGKAVKMQFRRYASDHRVGLHEQAYDYLTADGSGMGSTVRLTDVITTIYSVMA